MIVLLGAAAGFVASLQFPVQYAARAELVYLIGQEEPTGFLREDRNLTTQVILLRSRSVLEPVAATEGLTVKGLEDKFQVELVEGSEVIRLEVRDESREAGQAILTQIIDRYTTVSRDIAPEDPRLLADPARGGSSPARRAQPGGERARRADRARDDAVGSGRQPEPRRRAGEGRRGTVLGSRSRETRSRCSLARPAPSLASSWPEPWSWCRHDARQGCEPCHQLDDQASSAR